jgi:hypothetical protein
MLGEVGVSEAAPRSPIAQLHGVAGASQLDGGVSVTALLPQHEAEHFLVGGSECGERRFQPWSSSKPTGATGDRTASPAIRSRRRCRRISERR